MIVPLDGNMNTSCSDYDRDESFLKRARWHLQFVWWPRRCMFSGRWIWLERAQRGQAWWSGPGDDAIEVRWADDQEYMMWLLKK